MGPTSDEVAPQAANEPTQDCIIWALGTIFFVSYVY
jgi:hypothetical protein